MPYNPNLDIVLGDAQLGPILADLDAAKNALGAIATITLSAEESARLNKVNNARLPYVHRAVVEFGSTYTNLVSPRVTTSRAGNLLEALISLRQLESQLAEFQDRVKDLSFNVEEIIYNYTTDMYANAERYKGDVAGADVVAEYLGQLFAGQGPQNDPTPPTPPTP